MERFNISSFPAVVAVCGGDAGTTIRHTGTYQSAVRVVVIYDQTMHLTKQGGRQGDACLMHQP